MTVTAADLIQPPRYVQEIFDLDDGLPVVRRQWHTGRGNQRLLLAVTWYPGHFAGLVPELLSTAPSKGSGLLLRLQAATGRRPRNGRDDMHGREADAREANFLGLRTGSPILAGAHRLWDDQGVIEYGEWCLPYRLVVGYEYTLGASLRRCAEPCDRPGPDREPRGRPRAGVPPGCSRGEPVDAGVVQGIAGVDGAEPRPQVSGSGWFAGVRGASAPRGNGNVTSR
ncbi:UTRA domain-containing protein [Streptomyces sp. HPF1205]|uniref:UTRA domain-containing protein n=1 Tax=Streptomyces sp. HPF1205 TaxID=2873262 RepID=UPI001CED3A44|nr:UTRA domain-containing protein [Streptomyces sp. HPF1205]